MKKTKQLTTLLAVFVMLSVIVMGTTNSYTLSDYPSPLVTPEGEFDGEIIYGANADPSDIMGLVDAVAALAVIEVEEIVTSGDTISAEGEAAKVEKKTDRLAIGETLKSVKTVPFDEGDLPFVLADKTFVSEDGLEYDYTQEIDFNDTIKFEHFSDSDYNNKEPTLGVRIERGINFLTYTLKFTKAAKSDIDDENLIDFEDTEITIMGNKYDIVTALFEDGKTKIELMGGAIKDTLEQGQVRSYILSGKEFEVEVPYIGATPEVKFKVNGELTKSLQEGQTDKLSDGTIVGVRDIMEEEAGEVANDMVEFYLGAEKVTLDDGDNLEMNDEDIDDLVVDINEINSSDSVEISSISIVWIPDDDLFITEKESATLPGLESIKVSYEGLTAPKPEIVEIENDGDNMIALTLPLEGGDVTFDLLNSSNGTNFDSIGGEDSDEILITDATVITTYDRNINNYFIVSNSNARESHLVSVTKIDNSNGVTFKDLATGTKYENRKTGSFSIGDCTIDVGDYDETLQTVDIQVIGIGAVGDVLFTKEGLTLDLSTIVLPATTVDLVFIEENKNEELGLGETFTIIVEAAEKADVSGTSIVTYEIEDSDKYIGYVVSDLGTKVMHDQGPDQHTAKIEYYGEEVYGNVYISETETTFLSITGDTQTVYKRVDIPLAKSDADILKVDPTMTKTNYLLVGGPCANKATAKVMDVVTSWPDCAEGFEEGIGRIILKETSDDTVAIIVAGMTALDTTRATRVLEGYATEYSMEGTEIEVIGTTSKPVTVNVVDNEEE